MKSLRAACGLDLFEYRSRTGEATFANMPSGADAPAGKYKRLTQRQRFMFVAIVTGFLSADAMADMFEGCLGSTRSNFSEENFKEVIGDATDYIMSSDRLVMQFGYSVRDDASRSSVRKLIKQSCEYWFRGFATTQRQSFEDLPRATKSDQGLSDADFRCLGELLQTQEWRDSQGNMRRYSGLEAILHDSTRDSEDANLTESQRGSAKAVARRLLDIKAAATGAGGDNLDNLLDRVAAKCGCAAMHCWHAWQFLL